MWRGRADRADVEKPAWRPERPRRQAAPARHERQLGERAPSGRRGAGAEGLEPRDIFLVREALYQLSYAPRSDGRLYRRGDDGPRGSLGADRARAGGPDRRRRLSPVEAVAGAVERAIEVQPASRTASPRSGSTRPCSPPTAPSRPSPRATSSRSSTACRSPSRTRRPVAGHRTTLGSSTPSSTGVPDRRSMPTSSPPCAGRRRHRHRPDDDPAVCQFAHTLQTDSPLWGVTRNPGTHDVTRTPADRPGAAAGSRSPRGACPWPRAPTWAGRSASRRRGAGSSGSSGPPRPHPDGRAPRPVRLVLPPRPAGPLRRRCPAVPRRDTGPRRRRHPVGPRAPRPVGNPSTGT